MASNPTRPRANDADHHVGARIRERRIMLGLSQQQMADLIGVTYQQADNDERGINRISAGRLHETAVVRGRVPVGYFFEGLQSERAVELSAKQRRCLELARNFANITNERHQEALSQLARALAAEDTKICPRRPAPVPVPPQPSPMREKDVNQRILCENFRHRAV